MSLLIQNLLQPPVLFFLLGMVAVVCKSDLDLPEPIPKALAIYLIFAIGLHGGVSLAKTGLSLSVASPLVLAFVMASVTPFVTYYILKRFLVSFDAAAIAAAYGSVSAVTFLTACNFLVETGQSYGGHMVAALAIMEFPAIVVGLLCLRLELQKQKKATDSSFRLAHLFHESLFNGSVFLLLGSLVIGYVTGEKGWSKVSPFAHELFVGALCLFLLEMGMSAAKRIRGLKQAGIFPVLFAIGFPLVAGSLGIGLAVLLRMPVGDALLFAILCASASYIAVPAVMRVSVPEANPGLYIPMALGLTFPFNVLVSIPLFFEIIKRIWS